MKKLFFIMKSIEKPSEFSFSVVFGLRILIFSRVFGEKTSEFSFSVALGHRILIFSLLFVAKAIKSYVFAISVHAFSIPNHVHVRKPWGFFRFADPELKA